MGKKSCKPYGTPEAEKPISEGEDRLTRGITGAGKLTSIKAPGHKIAGKSGCSEIRHND